MKPNGNRVGHRRSIRRIQRPKLMPLSRRFQPQIVRLPQSLVPVHQIVLTQ